jgi:hypothetical protein
MLGRDEKKQSDHGENLQPATLLWLGDNSIIQGHPYIQDPWIRVYSKRRAAVVVRRPWNNKRKRCSMSRK